MLIGGDMLPVLFDVRLIGGGFCFGYDFRRRMLSSHSALVPVLESLWNSMSKETLSDFPDFLGGRDAVGANPVWNFPPTRSAP
jgi:hypothetical protein